MAAEAEFASPDEAPADFQLLEVQCPDDIGITSLESSRLPEGWRDNRPLTQRLGTEWLRSRSSALLRVPSAIVPNSFNYLFNPCTTRPAACRSGHRVVFNVCGNKYRIAVLTDYERHGMLIRFVGTHEQYDAIKDIEHI